MNFAVIGLGSFGIKRAQAIKNSISKFVPIAQVKKKSMSWPISTIRGN